VAERKKKTTKADATRRQLLDAALAVIAERGYAEATVDRIVEVAGVSKGVAYYHFSSKADIAESILVEGIGDLIASFEVIAEDAPTATEALISMIEVFASVIFENPSFGRFFVAELWRPGRAWSEAMRGHEQRLLTLLQAQLVRGQREGTVRSELDPAFEAVALVGMVLTTTLYYIGEGETRGDFLSQRQRFVARICDFVHHANVPPVS
jgi:AcrR family transcriptional regulator